MRGPGDGSHSRAERTRPPERRAAEPGGRGSAPGSGRPRSTGTAGPRRAARSARSVPSQASDRQDVADARAEPQEEGQPSEIGEGDVDELDPDERAHEPADAIVEQVATQQVDRAARAERHAREGE